MTIALSSSAKRKDSFFKADSDVKALKGFAYSEEDLGKSLSVCRDPPKMNILCASSDGATTPEE